MDGQGLLTPRVETKTSEPKETLLPIKKELSTHQTTFMKIAKVLIASMKKNQGEKGNRLCDEMDLDKLYDQYNETKGSKFRNTNLKASVSKQEKHEMFSMFNKSIHQERDKISAPFNLFSNNRLKNSSPSPSPHK